MWLKLIKHLHIKSAAVRTARIASCNTGTDIEFPTWWPLRDRGVWAAFQGRSPVRKPWSLAISATVILLCSWTIQCWGILWQKVTSDRPDTDLSTIGLIDSIWTEEQALVSHHPRDEHRPAVNVGTRPTLTTANFLPAPMSMQQWSEAGSAPAFFSDLRPASMFLRAVALPAATMHMASRVNDMTMTAMTVTSMTTTSQFNATTF